MAYVKQQYSPTALPGYLGDPENGYYGWQNLTPEEEARIVQPSDEGFFGGIINGLKDGVSGLPGALKEMKGGLSVALGGPTLGGAITGALPGGVGALNGAGSFAGNIAGAGNPAWGSLDAGPGAFNTGGEVVTGSGGGAGGGPNWGSLDAGPGAYETGGEIVKTGTPGAIPGAVSNAAGSAGGSLLSKLVGSDNVDLAKMLASLGAAGLGAIGANQQSKDYKDLADKYISFGAPSRQRYDASYGPGFTMANDPGYTDALKQASKANLYALSPQGNPALSPNAQAQNERDLYEKTAYPALINYRNTNSNAGGISSLTAAAPAANYSAITSGAGVYNAVGAGINDIFNPPKTLAQTLAEYRRAIGG